MLEYSDKALLEELSNTFLEATVARRTGNVDRAVELLNEVVRGEPRLPEPHFELGHIHLAAGRIDEAEYQARTALKWLEQGGQWVDDIPENVMFSLAHGLLGEVLHQKATSDDVVFGDPDKFQDLIQEAKAHFATSTEFDPSNKHADHHSFYMELDGPDMPQA
jgi:tetratricopeptide (TPR) repeat protein